MTNMQKEKPDILVLPSLGVQSLLARLLVGWPLAVAPSLSG